MGQPYTPADDEALGDAFQAAYDHGAPSRPAHPRARQLDEEDRHAREAMGEAPYPAGDHDEV